MCVCVCCSVLLSAVSRLYVGLYGTTQCGQIRKGVRMCMRICLGGGRKLCGCVHCGAQAKFPSLSVVQKVARAVIDNS